jgi:hypothetical protein
MSAPPADRPQTGAARAAAGALALAALALAAASLAHSYVSRPDVPRPHDFLQVWSAGRLALGGGNPYDGAQMYALQVANRMPDTRTPERPDGYASMMWVPPWGLAVAAPLGALPVDAAQMVWVYGQLAAIVACAALLWCLYGGPRDRAWGAAALALGFGPVWWQTVGGQYGGELLLSVTGFLAAHRANRPVLAGACLALAALKPHLFTLLAVGLLIDAARSARGRKVVLGGALALLGGALAVTAANPHAWAQYLAAASGGGSPYYPGLAEWFNPTLHAWARRAIPGRPFWVQFVPVAVAAPLFAAYWWRRAGPTRWPGALPWVLPACLIVAPYGSWPSDQVLFLVPVVGLAARLSARAVPPSRVAAELAAFVAASVAVVVMTGAQAELQFYVWLAPLLLACLVRVDHVLRSAEPAGPDA